MKTSRPTLVDAERVLAARAQSASRSRRAGRRSACSGSGSAEDLHDQRREDRDQHHDQDDAERDERDLVAAQPPPEQLQRRAGGDLGRRLVRQVGGLALKERLGGPGAHARAPTCVVSSCLMGPSPRSCSTFATGGQVPAPPHREEPPANGAQATPLGGHMSGDLTTNNLSFTQAPEPSDSSSDNEVPKRCASLARVSARRRAFSPGYPSAAFSHLAARPNGSVAGRRRAERTARPQGRLPGAGPVVSAAGGHQTAPHEDPHPHGLLDDGRCRRSDRRRPGDRPGPGRDPHHLDREGHAAARPVPRSILKGVSITAHAQLITPTDMDPPIVERVEILVGKGLIWNDGKYTECSKQVLDRRGPSGCPADVADGIGHRDGHGRHDSCPRGSAHLQRGRAPEVRLRDAQQPRARQRGADRRFREAPGQRPVGPPGDDPRPRGASRSSPASRCG